MTRKQASLITIFFVCIAFVWCMLAERSQSRLMREEHVEAFFLILLFSLIGAAFTNELSCKKLAVLCGGLTTGLMMYMFVRSLLYDTLFDSFLVVAILAGTAVALLAQWVLVKLVPKQRG